MRWTLLLLLAACAANDAPPLVTAARSGDALAVRRLVKAGADPNGRAGALRWTPLMHAIYKNQPGAVRALLDAGADANRTFDFESEPRTKQTEVTPLMMAAAYGQTETVRLLLARGADPALADGDGNRALDYALTGVLYRSVFACHDGATRALLAAHAPAAREEALRWAKRKRCYSAGGLGGVAGLEGGVAPSGRAGAAGGPGGTVLP